MTPKEKRIWASIWHSEAGLDGLNSYDSAYLSVGGIQKTMGVGGSKGELQGTFAYIKSKNPAIYNQYLGNFGFDIVECADANANVPSAHCKVGAVVLNTAEAKSNELSKFIWAYRSRKALNDPAFQKLYLESSIKRLSEIKGWKTYKYDGYEVKIGDVFKTELALAILLDSHINSPKYMKVIATKAILEVNSVFDKIKNGTAATITIAEEKNLIKKLVTYRRTNASVSVEADDPDRPGHKKQFTAPMTDPKLRTAFIVMCVENIQTDNTLLTDIGYSSLNQIKTDAGISNNSNFYNFLKVERS
ncbi:MAG TPA: hypothetical protein VHO70_02685 [Chitinispirillaceae bacterium]|nr:hypothetical protein [Chitinispirillaceae bacterium]